MKTENILPGKLKSIPAEKIPFTGYSVGRHIPEFIFLPSVLRDQIDRLMLSGRPILLFGEPGADLSEITGYIRARLQALQGRYVELGGEGDPIKRLEQVLAAIPDDRRLTLCIPGFDTLTEQQQQKALALLRVEHARRSELRLVFGLIATLTEQRASPAQPGAQLVSAFGCQLLSVPALKGRTQDIAELVHAAWQAYRQSVRQTLHPEVLFHLHHYDWPGNVRQLWHSVARLLMLSDDAEIDLAQASSILPQIVTRTELEASGERQRINRSLCDAVLSRDQDALQQFHPSVIKALLYLGEHFQQEVTLIELAENSHISPSHLSYLLKHSLRLSFKQILNQTRIFYACQRLECHPMSRITNLYLDCGYGDLSHFEKMFKRYTGVTPIEFRKKFNPVVLRDETG
ncbi:helix-turn-helix domain-containing protein [Dickeya dadantii]|uniref:helix-turn-helix domain-containing protein n=1 Tax=Dickeya dadantii TaxID=204038 RepID=UPI001495D5D6|nr:helix-turn-helix domain-containing protein [Dickeya dadantii]NPE65659.1 helix-turn-helix domain-containing protein [Dickeya dadantii]